MTREANPAVTSTATLPGADGVTRGTAADPADFRSLFQGMPGRCVALAPDAPRFTIVAATDAYCHETGTPRDAMLGRGLFEVFGDATSSAPTALERRTEAGLRASFAEVLRTGATHRPPVQRYDVIGADGRGRVCYWQPVNAPVLGADGAVRYLLHQVEQATDVVLHQEAAAAAERRATRILDQVSDEHLTMDAEFRILTVNAAAERALGMTRDELRGRTHWEAFPASVGSVAEREYRRVVTERVEVHFTHHYVGERYDRYLEIDAYPTDEGGIAIFWRDVTERQRAEVALRESEARYRALFDSLDEGFCVIEVLFDAEARPADYRFLEANPAFVEQTGLVNAIGRTAREMLPDLEAHWFEAYGRVAATGEATRFQLGSDVMGRWFDVYAFRVGAAGERRVAILFKDVSAAKAAERERERLLGALEVERARLEEVFRRAPSFIVALRGPEQVYEFVNEAYYQLVGHREVVGKPLLQAIPEIRDQGFKELLDRVRETGEAWVGREAPVLLQRTPGAAPETRYLDMVFQALAEADGTRSGVVVHGSDVTAQVVARREVERLLAESEQARAEAERARAEAEAANRAKGDFLAVMSHELRTPLNAIGGYAELMEMGIRGPVTPQQQDDLARIQRSQRHLLGLVNEVLNYAKLETGSVQYQLAQVEVREAIAAAEALVAPQARAKGLTLGLGTCERDVAVRADAEKLRQILVNLLSNAVKFTDPGGHIEVTCAAHDTDVHVTIHDTGIGIPADRLETIFDPFVQVRADLTRTAEGTGLGLAISRDLARGMGGALTAESTPGTGSRFTLTLPRA